MKRASDIGGGVAVLVFLVLGIVVSPFYWVGFFAACCALGILLWAWRSWRRLP